MRVRSCDVFRPIVAACAIIGAAGLDDPPFNTTVALEGSAEFVEEDWDLTCPASGNLEMTAEGLFLKGATKDDLIIAQYKHEITPMSGTTFTARFRIRFDHPDDTETKFGFYSASTDPFGTEPDVGAYFKVVKLLPPQGNDGKLLLVRRESGEDPVEVDLNQVVEEGDFFDFVVQVISTTSIKFWWLDHDGGGWDSRTYTTDLPDDAMRYSIATKNITGSASNLEVHIFELD